MELMLIFFIGSWQIHHVFFRNNEMKDYYKKVKNILPALIFAILISTMFCFLLRYIIEIKLGIDVKLITWEFIIPFIIAVLFIILIRKKFIVLKFKNKEKDNFYIYLDILASYSFTSCNISEIFH